MGNLVRGGGCVALILRDVAVRAGVAQVLTPQAQTCESHHQQQGGVGRGYDGGYRSGRRCRPPCAAGRGGARPRWIYLMFELSIVAAGWGGGDTESPVCVL